jgi:hypothetical protein
MKILYVERERYEGTVILPPGCVLLLFQPDEGHIAEGVITRLIKMGVEAPILYEIYEKVRVTHDKSEEQ